MSFKDGKNLPPNRQQKLYTQLSADGRFDSFEDYSTKETYQAVMKWLSLTKYSLFGTITFRFGGQSRDSLEGIARRVKRFLGKKIQDLRIVFVFEEHRLNGTPIPSYHIHFLVESTTTPIAAFKAKLNSICKRIRGDGLYRVCIGITDVREIFDQKDLVDYLSKSIRQGDCSKLQIDYINSDLPMYQP